MEKPLIERNPLPPPANLVCGIKCMIVLFAISGVTIVIAGDPDPDFWLAYLTD